MGPHSLIKPLSILDRIKRKWINRTSERKTMLNQLNRASFNELHRNPYILTFKTEGTFTESGGVLGVITVRVVPVNRRLARNHNSHSKEDEVMWVGMSSYSSELLLYNISGKLLNGELKGLYYYPVHEWDLNEVIDYEEVDNLNSLVYYDNKLMFLRNFDPYVILAK